jgi:hypothetical protein
MRRGLPGRPIIAQPKQVTTRQLARACVLGSDPSPSHAQELRISPGMSTDGRHGCRSYLSCLPLYERFPWGGGPCRYPHRGLPPACAPGSVESASPMTRRPRRRSTRRKYTGMGDKKVWFITGAGRGMGVDIADERTPRLHDLRHTYASLMIAAELLRVTRRSRILCSTDQREDVCAGRSGNLAGALGGVRARRDSNPQPSDP